MASFFREKRNHGEEEEEEEEEEFFYSIDRDEGPAFDLNFKQLLDAVDDDGTQVVRVSELTSMRSFSNDLVKIGVLPLSYLPLPNTDAAPYIWEFTHSADWHEDDFSQIYWEVAFTFPCESKQFTEFGLGTVESIEAVCFQPHREHTRIVPSDEVVACVSRHWRDRSKKDLTFNLFKEKHELSRRVEFVVLFEGEMKRYIPHLHGKTSFSVDKETGMVVHTTTVSAVIAFGYTEGNFLTISTGKVFNTIMADKIKKGLDHILGLLFTKTHILYTNAELELSKKKSD